MDKINLLEEFVEFASFDVDRNIVAGQIIFIALRLNKTKCLRDPRAYFAQDEKD